MFLTGQLLGKTTRFGFAIPKRRPVLPQPVVRIKQRPQHQQK
jgi:hypothetical protein